MKAQSAFSDEQKGILFTLAGAFFFTLTTAVSKEVTPETNALFVTFFRNLIGLIILTALHIKTRGLSFPRPKASFKNHFLRAALGLMATAFLFQSFASLPMQNATALTFTGPFFTTLLSFTLLKEYVGRSKWLSIGTGFLGVLLILNVTAHLSISGFVFGLLAALCNAGAIIVIKSISKTEPSFVIVYFYTLLATLISALWMPFNWFPMTAEIAILLILLSACSIAAHYLIAKGLSLAPASTLSPFNYSSLIWSTFIGLIIWQESLTITGVAGCILIGASGYMITRKKL